LRVGSVMVKAHARRYFLDRSPSRYRLLIYRKSNPQQSSIRNSVRNLRNLHLHVASRGSSTRGDEHHFL
jgi:hypothetical protein